ncbi:hypothetical protein JW979_03425, partial [bacterium]|nr:hypothetical protein [candidate division CSSED10-310 bacterium]
MVKLKFVKYHILLMYVFFVASGSADSYSLYPNPEARYVGMGSAYVASVQGPVALLCNPAGLMDNSNYSFALNIGNGSGYNEQFIAGRFLIGSNVSIGLGVHRLALESEIGDSIGFITGVASELIEEELSIGGTIQGFVNSQSVNGMRISIGMQYTPHKIISIGTSVSSRGAFKNDSEAKIRIPFHARTGIQVRPFSSLAINADAELARKNKKRELGELARINYGFEWKLPLQMVSNDLSNKFSLFLRGGTRSGVVESDEGGVLYTWKR